MAEAPGASIFMQADSWEELRRNVREALCAFYFDRNAPESIRLYLMRDEVLSPDRDPAKVGQKLTAGQGLRVRPQTRQPQQMPQKLHAQRRRPKARPTLPIRHAGARFQLLHGKLYRQRFRTAAAQICVDMLQILPESMIFAIGPHRR